MAEEKPKTDIQPASAPAEPSGEELASFIRIFWTALIEQPWTKDGLIDLGKAVFAKKSLGDLSNPQLELLLPRLKGISLDLIRRLQPRIPPLPKKEPATKEEGTT